MPFNPTRLALARRRRGINKTELARAAGVSLRMISAYEAGASEPSRSTLHDLARATRFPSSFFLADDASEIQVSAASFRSLSTMTARQRDSVLGAGSLALLVNAYLERCLELPRHNLPDMRHAEPEEAASALRADWGCGVSPIANVVHLLEAHGVRVFSLAEDCRDVDAFSAWNEGTPFVFLNTIKSGERGRFDAGHELGHLVLHKHGPPEGRRAEAEADRFASAFLMPRAPIVATAPRIASLDRFLALKRTWRVSVAAVVRRLHDTGMLTRWQYEHACIEISRRGWRSAEPDGIERESSQLFAKAFAALREDGITPASVADALNISTDDLSALTFNAVPRALPGGNAPNATRARTRLRLV